VDKGNSAHEVSTGVAARILGFSRRHIAWMCQNRHFKTAHKPGGGTSAHYRILRTEVIARKYNATINQEI
jgi:hypothetical protein